MKVKRLILVGSLAMLLAPFMAHGQKPVENDWRRHKISAKEMNVIGFAAAATLGAIGYLVLRRRNTSS